jgi:(p)ppGpp synthase/HD superfamily hydrolase
MTSILHTAEHIARTAHAGQIEKLTGDDYIRHVERVVALVDSNAAKVVAWLHDVIEDTTVTAADLRAAGIPETLVADVVALTRVKPHIYAGSKGDAYREYLTTLIAHDSAVATAVKIADLTDHLRPMETLVLPSGMRKRYEKALKTLTR